MSDEFNKVMKRNAEAGAGVIKCRCGNEVKYDIILGVGVERRMTEGEQVQHVIVCNLCHREVEL